MFRWSCRRRDKNVALRFTRYFVLARAERPGGAIAPYHTHRAGHPSMLERFQSVHAVVLWRFPEGRSTLPKPTGSAGPDGALAGIEFYANFACPSSGSLRHRPCDVRDPKIVLGLMAFWTFVLIAWALFENVLATP